MKGRLNGRLTAALLLLAGCQGDVDPWAELPEPDQIGERVVVATDAAERVCAGTLAMIDAEVERIEVELELQRTTDPYRVWILEPERASSICESRSSCANIHHGAIVAADNLEVERRTARELTPLLLARAGIETPRFFVEGLARATSWPTCPSPLLPPDELGGWIDYVDSSGNSQALAGELLSWLLVEYGAANLFDFLRMLPKRARSYTTRVLYAAYFGSTIEQDAFDHVGSFDSATHCFAPAPAPIDSRRLALRASLDCDSARVQTDFDTPGFGFVEWTLAADRAGLYRLHGELPEGSRLEITACACDERRDPFRPFAANGEQLLRQQHQLRWHGPLDAGLELDVEIEVPCSVLEQDCPAGSKCLWHYLSCQPLVEEPIAMGEPCELGPGALDPCVAGARCLGEPNASGVTSGRCVRQCLGGDDEYCDAGERCASDFAACGPTCNDPINDDCGGIDIACTPSSDAMTCLPIGTGTLLEPCSSLCAPGFVCRTGHNLPCEGKCCVPVCDPALDDADCPAGVPRCRPHYGTDQTALGYCELEL